MNCLDKEKVQGLLLLWHAKAVSTTISHLPFSAAAEPLLAFTLYLTPSNRGRREGRQASSSDLCIAETCLFSGALPNSAILG